MKLSIKLFILIGGFSLLVAVVSGSSGRRAGSTDTVRIVRA